MMSIDILLAKVKEYNENEIEKVKKAYEFAERLHKGQTRQSGEPYIVHPLNVAYILAEIHADADTLCAGLLHDTLEDTDTTKEEIANLFNPEVAKLVDGATKIRRMNFSSKSAQNYANTRKIITSLTEDVRIIIIKLADRLHNMRTLQFKSEFKQKENALETMEIFVPLAYQIGAYRIKQELEDLSFRYLKPDIYDHISAKRTIIERESEQCVKDMLEKIHAVLCDKQIPNEIKVRTKNIYGIYKKISRGDKISEIHDLLSLKILVDEIDDCYLALRPIHAMYHPVNRKFKDYIANPKTNMYQSLHTTVFGLDDRLVQLQLRTHDMDKVASFGLATYWDINKGRAREVMQEELKSKFQFYQSLLEINEVFRDNQAFIYQAKNEIFADKVYVYTPKGDVMELPKGATAIDFAYKIHTDVGNTMVGAIVNDRYVPVNYVLQNNDRVKIVTDELSYGARDSWEDMAKTTYAKRKIREFKTK